MGLFIAAVKDARTNWVVGFDIRDAERASLGTADGQVHDLGREGMSVTRFFLLMD